MASRKTTLAIASFVLITVLLIILLVLVSITFSKVNKKSTSLEATTNAPPKSTTQGTYTVDYGLTLETTQPWDPDLSNTSSDVYATNVSKYENLITNSLSSTFPGVNTTVTKFEQNTNPVSTVGPKSSYTSDGTVLVDAISYIPFTDGTTPAPSIVIENTIDSNISCACNVIDIKIITTTAAPPETTKTTQTAKYSSTTTVPPNYLAAEYLKQNMDERYSPCDNFYKFACGNFTTSFPTPNGVVGYGTFDLVQDQIVNNITSAIQTINVSDPNVPAWASKVRRFYDSCTSSQQQGIIGNTRLLEVIKAFDGWPIIMEPNTWNNKTFDLARTLATLTANFSVQTLISTDVDLDWLTPSRFILQVDQASLTLGNPDYYMNPKFRNDRKSYIELIKRTAAILRANENLPQEDEMVEQMAQDILDFETLLAKNIVTEDNRQNFTVMYNPMFPNTIEAAFKFMDWNTYFNTLLPDVVKQHAEPEPANVVEPQFMTNLTKIVTQTSAETLQNYLIWRLVYSLNMFLDDSLEDGMNVAEISLAFRKKYNKVETRVGVIEQLASPEDCVMYIINNLAFAASNLLVGNELVEESKNEAEVLNMTNYLKESFKHQLDTLFWMDDATRQYAKTKLDDYVELAGYPKWVLNDTMLNEYFDAFFVLAPDQFFDNYIELMTFHELTRFRILADKKVKRATWIMPPPIVNAWYLPDFNSITFPAGILRPPFFRYDFPKAVNYGALGTVIGHEITHGFDDQGVQFDGTGLLHNWMSANSLMGFNRMIDCVIHQYDRTCFPVVNMCIDGVQTQGENTADNGGIREAYNAYKQWVSEHGEEQPLPGLENYSMEQIFFISFANVWCGDYETEDYLEQQIVTNVHSPPPARVLNTLKNFAEFGQVFNCEVGDHYYPYRSDACYVWYSPNVSTNVVYNKSAQYFLSNMNDRIDPCNDFYNYACGSFPQNHNVPPDASVYNIISVMQNRIYEDIVNKLQILPTNTPKSIQSAKVYYDICSNSNNTELINNTEILNALTMLGGWPAIDPYWTPPQDIKKNMSQLVGYLLSMFGVQTFLVASTVVDPGNTSRHVLAIDQSSLALGSPEYYLNETLNVTFQEYQNLITSVIIILGNSSGVTIDAETAASISSNIAAFEKNISQLLYTDKERTNFTLLYNLYNVSELTGQFIHFDWLSYFGALVAFSPDLQDYFAQENASVVISEPDFFHKLGCLAYEHNKSDPKLIQNYLLWRLIFTRLNFMDKNIQDQYASFKKKTQLYKDLPPDSLSCVDQLNNMLGYTVGRVFVHDWNLRKGWRDDVTQMIENITSAFNETIPMLDWMDKKSRSGAKNKIQMLVENPAFPDWILNDTLLDEYYHNYTINKDSTYFEAFNQLNQYSVAKGFEAILQPVNRKDFQMSPATVNAWYNPTLNSLTVPAGFLNPPVYDPQLPPSMKYGYVGIVMGHELTHAFDDSGIQFDGDGMLDLWMSPYSRDSYDKYVASCIINQYDQYCHFNGTFCVDGIRTQGENIADNGGVRQAFKAYRNYIKDNPGYTEELLPGMEWFNEDQLFFLSYANLWCGYYSDNFVLNELLTDVHSPGMDRVKGVVSNFDEFDTAFKCKFGDQMDPVDKCYVWTNPTQTTEGYNKAAKMFLESLDPTAQPCDDFFQYACGGWIHRHPIPNGAPSISTNSLSEDAVLLQTTQGIEQVQPNVTSEALQKTKQMFDFCKQDLNNTNSSSMLSFQQYMNSILGGWPVITKFWTQPDGITDLQQMFKVTGILGSLGLSTLFNAYPQPNFEPKTDPPKGYALFIDQANLLLGNRDIYLNKTFTSMIAQYRDKLIVTAVEMATANCTDHNDRFDPNCRLTIPMESIQTDVEAIISFETSLARISLPGSLLENYTAMYNKFNFTELQTHYENIDWEMYLSNLLPQNIYQAVTSGQVDIILSEPSYVDGLNALIPYNSLRTIQNYLIWRYVTDSSALLGVGMRNRLWNLRGKSKYSETLRDEVSMCTQDTINLLPYASGRLYVEKAFGNKQSNLEIREKAQAIVQAVVDQFEQRLRNLSWLDPSSLSVAEQKAQDLVENIGYPDWIFNDTALDELYSLTIDTTLDYYTTKRQVSQWFYATRFNALNQSLSVHRANFQMSPAIQNAWYQPWLNSLTIPAGEIQPPFFHIDYPSAVNFGGLGAVAGHELTHGFDDEGYQFGPDGGLDNWMSQQSADYFQVNISECVVNQYNQYCYNNLTSGKMCINGAVTQGENIADNGGTKAAFNAYLEWVKQNGYEALLPGLESFTMDQIFFLEFAQSWCGAITPQALEQQLLLDVHSPYRDRVIGTLSNMKEFQAAFKCKPGDNMVPANRCDVW